MLAGAVNVVPSQRNRSGVGEQDCVCKLSFTGSTEVAMTLAQQSSTMKRTSMKLGRNAPFIMFFDADGRGGGAEHDGKQGLRRAFGAPALRRVPQGPGRRGGGAVLATASAARKDKSRSQGPVQGRRGGVRVLDW